MCWMYSKFFRFAAICNGDDEAPAAFAVNNGCPAVEPRMWHALLYRWVYID